MAVGGWIYGGCTTQGIFANTQANWEVAWQSVLDLLTGLPGWSELVPLTQYISATQGAYYAVCKYGGVGDNGYLVFVFSYTNSSPVYDASNILTNMYTTAYNVPEILCSWIPPGVAPPGAGNPKTASWIPTGAMKLQYATNRLSTDITTQQFQIHVIARGQDVILVGVKWSHSTKRLSTVFLAGKMLELAHAADTYVDADCAQIGWIGSGDSAQAKFGDPTLSDKPNYSYVRNGDAQCFDAVGNIRSKAHGLSLSIPTGLFAPEINRKAPLLWSRYTMYISNSDLTTYGVIPGYGDKGTINPEWIRAVYGQRIQPRQTTESGNMLSVGAGSGSTYGLIIGWDSTNGPMVGGE